MNSDNQLLESYAGNGSERAFREFVERHIGLVHSAALRESKGNLSMAEDITQAVFTELALRAATLVGHPALSGWLYTCVRRMAANVRRSEDRRHRREQELFSMNELLSAQPSDNLWQQVRPVLDDVMHELNEQDRTAVVLRFFEGRSLKEVGLALGVSENAARMRVDRSLEKLHDLLAQRGVTSTSSALVAVLAAGAVMTVPATLASMVATVALATAASSTSAAFAVKKLLCAAKAKFAAAGALLVLVSAFSLWHHVRSKGPVRQAHGQGESTASTEQPAGPTNPAAPDDFAVAVNPAAVSQMILQLVDAESGEPLPEAKLHLFYLLQDGRGSTVKQVTDFNGKVGVKTVERPFRNLNMFVTAEGHVPKVTSWGATRAAMPSEYTMKMERGLIIGGVVVDEAAQPIAGAKIEFDVRGNNHALQENIQFGPDTVTYSDFDGRWSCNMIPKDLGPVSIVARHHEHAETKATIEPQAPGADNLIITMPVGFTVAGTVQDTNGNPIASAKVRDVRQNSEGETSRRSDSSGAFEFNSVKAGELMLAVQARGFAPAVQTFQVTGNLADVRFQLGPGQLLRGRVTDEDGKPIGGAWVEITRRGGDKVEWSTRTHADGRFEWDSAPAEPLLYSMQAEGFNHAYALELVANGSEHRIKMNREEPGKDTVEITGTVLDAEANQPLDDFNVFVGDLGPDSAFPFRFVAVGKKGRFSASFSSKHSYFPDYQLQIEKDGYLPALSPQFSKKDGSRTLNFSLKKGSGPSGAVLLPDGEAAENAAVLLCTAQAGVTIDGPAHVEKGLNTTTYRRQTDAGGAFSLPPVIAPQGLVVVHDQGYLELSPINSSALGKVKLRPWGRVEGKLILDGQPVANERIVAYNHVAGYSDAGRRVTFVTFHLETKTDSAGKFCFDKVPPGQCKIFRQTLSFPNGFESHDTAALVNAGAATHVILGGTGRPVIGKAILAGATQSIDWQTVSVRLREASAHDLSPRPSREQFSSKGAYIAAAEQFFATIHNQRRFGAFCDRNGSFRVQDVPAGAYQLEIKIRDSKANSIKPSDSPSAPTEIGSLLREIIVPELADGQTAEPLDLGVLELRPRRIALRRAETN